MKKLILASLIVLGAFVACTPKEGATTPEPTPTDPAANNATPDPAPEADGKGAPAEGEAEGK